MSRLDAAAMAVLLGLCRCPEAREITSCMQDHRHIGWIKALLGEADRLSGRARAEYLTKLSGRVVQEELRWWND